MREGEGPAARPAQVQSTGEIPLFRSFYRQLCCGAERSGAEWTGETRGFVPFLVPSHSTVGRITDVDGRRAARLATSKSNSIPFSRERKDHFRGEGRDGVDVRLSHASTSIH